MIRPPAPAPSGRAISFITPIALAAALAGCSHIAPGPYSDRRLREPLDETERPAEGAAPTLAVPAPRTLADLLDAALSKDPSTRAAWHDARSAAATAGARRAAWLPSGDVTGTAVQQQVVSAGRVIPSADAATISGQLTWLLVDLGARSASQDEANHLLVAARLAHEVAVLDTALRVEEAYYLYLASRALAAAAGSAVAQAQASLDAAEARRAAGAATIADVLQARTALSQARLEERRQEGAVLAFRGTLATLAGLPATTPLEVGDLPAQLESAAALPAVEGLLEEAARRGPDLRRARAAAEAAGARARSIERSLLPTLTLGASRGVTWPIDPTGDRLDAWSLGLTLRLPVFDWLRTPFDALAAQEGAEALRDRAEATGQRVQLDVWSSFQALRTAGQRLDASRDLLAAAAAGLDVAQARYREGVGSILDLLTAQSALENARAEDIRARADLLLSVARLARATGRLEPAALRGASTGAQP